MPELETESEMEPRHPGPQGQGFFHSTIPLPRKPLPGEHPQAPGGHKLTISLGGIGSKVENMAQHPEPQREEPRVMAGHIPRRPPQPWGMLTHRNQGPTRHPDHTPQTRLSLQKGPKPAACPEGQIYNPPSFPPHPRSPKQAKL